MAITTLQENLDFNEIFSSGVFEITADNDILKLTSSQGGPQSIDVADGTYEGDGLATALQTAMNADDTLTGTGTITFVVTYSSSTSKFTLDATSGNTIAYTHTGSDAGLTFGFSSDKSAAETITGDNAVPGDPADIITSVHNGVEEAVIQYCFRVFDSTAYTHQLYTWRHGNTIWLKQYPVTAIAGIYIGRLDGIRIKSTSLDASNATATISTSDSKLTLAITGGNDDGSNDVAFATYTTLSAVVTQINTLTGWSAEISDSNLNDLKSTELLPVIGKYVGSRRNIEATFSALEIPDDPISDHEVDLDIGQIEISPFYYSDSYYADYHSRFHYYPSYYRRGFQQIAISYTAGYSIMPGDLKLAVLRWVKAIYDKILEDGDGLTRFSALGTSTAYILTNMPIEVEATLVNYQRNEIT